MVGLFPPLNINAYLIMLLVLQILPSVTKDITHPRSLPLFRRGDA
jgi:hypothetical protein